MLSGIYYSIYWFIYPLTVSIQVTDVPELLIHFTMFLQNKHDKDVHTVLTEFEIISEKFHLTYIFDAGSRHTNCQAPTTNRWYHFRCRIATQDQSASGHVLFHGSTQGMLSIFGEFVNLCQ